MTKPTTSNSNVAVAVAAGVVALVATRFALKRFKNRKAHD